MLMCSQTEEVAQLNHSMANSICKSVIVLKVFLQPMADGRVASSCHCPRMILQARPYRNAKAFVCAAVNQDSPLCTRLLRKLACE